MEVPEDGPVRQSGPLQCVVLAAKQEPLIESPQSIPVHYLSRHKARDQQIPKVETTTGHQS